MASTATNGFSWQQLAANQPQPGDLVVLRMSHGSLFALQWDDRHPTARPEHYLAWTWCGPLPQVSPASGWQGFKQRQPSHGDLVVVHSAGTYMAMRWTAYEDGRRHPNYSNHEWFSPLPALPASLLEANDPGLAPVPRAHSSTSWTPQGPMSTTISFSRIPPDTQIQILPRGGRDD